MAVKIDQAALGRLRERLERVIAPGSARAATLMERLEKTMVEDNRRGLLRGEDRDGRRLIPVTYRTGVRGKVGRRKAAAFGTVAGAFSGGPGGNLTTAEYRLLTGPPLVPRGESSRLITNYATGHKITGPNQFEVIGTWVDIVSRKGVPFMIYHFTGAGRLPVRDVRGVRPWGHERARKEAMAWLRDLIRKGGA